MPKKFLPLTLALLLCLSPAAFAQTDWTGGGGAGDPGWDDPDNWEDGTIPGTTSGSTNADTALFRADPSGVPPANRTIDVDANRLIHRMEFGRLDDTSPDFTFIGETLRVADGGGIVAFRAPGSDKTFDVAIFVEPLNATADASILISDRVSGGGGFVFNGGISGGNTSGSVTLELRGSNDAGFDFDSVISDGGAAGGLTLDVSTSQGNVWLRSANTYTGGTVVGSGHFSVFVDDPEDEDRITSAFGTGTITVNNALRFTGGDSSLTIANDINLNGGITVVNQGSYTFNGNITLGTIEGATPTLNQNTGTQTYNGVISDGDHIVPLLGPT